MCSKKNYCWIWISVDRVGRGFIDLVLGSRGSETGLILFAKVFINSQTALYMTDYWKAYSEFIPGDLHVRSKAQTFTVEGFNSLLRHYLARLRRKTKRYTKSAMMLYYSLRLLFAERNNELSILF